MNGRRIAPVGELEAAHDTGQGDVGGTALERGNGSGGERGCLRIDVEAFDGEVAAMDGDRERCVEDRMERHDDSDSGGGAHGEGV